MLVTSIFSFFPQCFLVFPIQISTFLIRIILSSANSLNLGRSKILSFGKELNTLQSIKSAGYGITEIRLCMGMGEGRGRHLRQSPSSSPFVHSSIPSHGVAQLNPSGQSVWFVKHVGAMKIENTRIMLLGNGA